MALLSTANASRICALANVFEIQFRQFIPENEANNEGI